MHSWLLASYWSHCPLMVDISLLIAGVVEPTAPSRAEQQKTRKSQVQDNHPQVDPDKPWNI